MRRSPWLAVAGLTTVLVAAGCAGEGAPAEDSTPSVEASTETAATASAWDSASVDPAPGSLRRADGSVPEVSVVELSSGREAIEGNDYEVLSSSVPTSPESRLVPLALAADGRVFVTRVPDDQYDGGAWLEKPSEVGMLSESQLAVWPSSETALEDRYPRQVYAASTDGGDVAWAETESTQLGVSNWRIFVGDGTSPRLVARSEDVFDGPEGLPVVDGSTVPLLRGGRVYWATTIPLADGPDSMFGVQVMSRSADGHDTAVVEAHGATQPAVGAAGLYVARTTRDDPSIKDGTFSIDHADGHGTTSPVVTFEGESGTSVQSLVASEDRLAFVVASAGESGGQIVVLDVVTGAVTSIPLVPSGREVTLALCGDRLVWTSANGSAGVLDSASIGLLDLATGDLARVIEPRNFAGVQCAGDLVQWRTIDLPNGTGVPVVVRWLGR